MFVQALADSAVYFMDLARVKGIVRADVAVACDAPFFFAAIPGPEQFVAVHPMLIVTLIFGQIVAMLVLVRLFASKSPAPPSVAAQRPAHSL